MEMINIVIDEIALSGLQGVTVPKLWQCLTETDPPLLKDESDAELKSFLWRGILQCKEIEFYWHNPEKSPKAPEKKKKNKKVAENTVKGDSKDSCGGAKLPKDWISDTENEVCGYCTGYYSRENISSEVREKKLDYSEAFEKWQDMFFIVASQDVRRRALYGKDLPGDLGITDLRFTFLEIIGKGRSHGFYQKDFKQYSVDARSTFHQVKILWQQGLVTRQKFQMRRLKDAPTLNPTQTNILFLKRFHKTLSSESETYSTKLCEMLKNEPGDVMELSQLKARLNCSNKLFKRIRANLYSNGNIQYVQHDQVFNYSQGHESLMRKFVWSQPIYVQLIKEFKTPVNDGDDDEEEENYVSNCKYVNPQIVNEVHLNQQMYWLIENAKEKGMTVHEFGSMSCMPYHMVRSFARQLDRKNCAKVVITDKSRQKVHTLFSTKYLHQSEVVKQINKEFDRAEDLTHTPEADDTIQISAEADQNNGGNLEESFGSAGNLQKSQIEDKGNRQFIKNLELKPVNERKNNTVRGMKRKNIILEMIRNLRIIEGANPIYKTVSYQEQQQGIKEKVCRKSVYRIVSRMVQENLMKKFETVIKNAESKANVTYYCDPSISIEDEEFKTAVNETKFRLKGIVSRREVKEGKVKSNFLKNPDVGCPAPSNLSLLDYVGVNDGHETETDTEDEEYEPVQGSAYQRSQYGYLPRFPRMKMLQMYLWQLVYGTGEDAAKCDNVDDNNDHDEEEANDWRYERYGWFSELVKLPPNRYGSGYFQTGDALAIMPVIVFTKCVGICMKSKTLEKMLNHPKKRFTPLRDLPPKLKTKLFTAKNVGVYVGHFIDALVLLTYLGLLYITPERIPSNRTQIVMLVSKEAMLVDTTQSEKGYSNTKLPQHLKAFPKLSYRFDGLASIEKYWKDVQYICLNTRLGLIAAPKKDEEEKKTRPNRTLMTLRNFQEHFPAEESGSAKAKLFGDGLGAGGFDSTFFGHLAKNWSYPGLKKKVMPDFNKAEDTSNTMGGFNNRFGVPLKGFQQVIRSSVAVRASVGGRGKKRSWNFDNKIVSGATSSKKSKPEVKKPDDLKLKKIMAARYRQKLAKIKKTTPKSRSSTHRPSKDAIDLEAQKKMKSYRVNFSPVEDAAILMVRITAELLHFDKRKLNYWPTARDVLHLDVPATHDKTTESLSRRGRYILKNALTVENMKSCVLECRADRNLDTKPPDVKGNAWKTKFKELYSKVKEKYKTRLEPDDFTFEIPDTLQGLKEAFHINKAFEQKGPKKSSELKSSEDVNVLVLEELIHNSLAGQNSKEYMPSLVFRIFDRYPVRCLEKALLRLKAKSLIAKLRVNVPRRRALPISTMSYSLSLVYERIFEMPVTPHLFPAAKSFLRMIREGREHAERTLDRKQELLAEEITNGNNEDKQANETQVDQKAAVLSDNNASTTLHPGTIIYAKDEALGGHIACLLSLLVNEKAFLHLEIPDNIVQCDPEAIEKLEKSEDMFSSGSITLLKRKMYANNIEDALEKEEDKAMEEIEEDEDEETSQKPGDKRRNLSEGNVLLPHLVTASTSKTDDHATASTSKTDDDATASTSKTDDHATASTSQTDEHATASTSQTDDHATTSTSQTDDHATASTSKTDDHAIASTSKTDDDATASTSKTDDHAIASTSKTDDHATASTSKTDDHAIASTSKTDEHATASTSKTDDHAIASTSKTDDHAIASTSKTDDHATASTSKTDDHAIASTSKTDDHATASTSKTDDHAIASTSKTDDHATASTSKTDDHAIASTSKTDDDATASTSKTDDHAIASTSKTDDDATASTSKTDDHATASTSQMDDSAFKPRAGATLPASVNNINESGKKRKSALRVKEVDLTCLWGDDENSLVAKKKQKVSFQDETLNDAEASGKNITSESRSKKRSHDSDSKEETTNKKAKVVDNVSDQKNSHSGAVNFRMKGSLISTSFFSNRSLVDKYIDSYSNARSLKQDFGYLSSATDTAGLKPGMDIVPSRAFEMKKSKLYASRTTLMLHRSFSSDATQLQAKALNAHDDLNINPLTITCNMQLRPYHDNDLNTFICSESSSELYDVAQPIVSGYKGFETKIDRFRKKEETSYTEREIENGLDSLPENDFFMLMIDRFDWNKSEVEFGKEVLRCMRRNKEMGLAKADIENIYEKHTSLRPIDELTVMFVNFKVAYCVGMYTMRYVSPVYVKGWSINAPLSKGDEEEIMDVIAKNQIEAAAAKREKDSTKSGSAGSGDRIEKEVEGGVHDFGDTSDTKDNNSVTQDEIHRKEETCVAAEASKHSKETDFQTDCHPGKSPKSSQSKEDSDATPIAAVVKADPSKVKGGGGVRSSGPKGASATTRPRIGFEASDGSDTETVDQTAQSATGHVLGPISTKTEIGYKRATCKPWLKLNCEINFSLLNKFHRAVLSFILMCPGITESAIYSHFETLLRPMALKDILQFLELNGCVSKHFSRQKQRPSLFDPVEKIIEAGFSYDDPYYLPTENCVLNIAENF